MRLSLLVVRDAERQIREAADWWTANRPAARDLFHRELARGFDLITCQPGIGAKALDTPLAGVRRLDLFRIRYHLYYRVRNGEAIEVLAFWHASREKAPPL